MKATTEHIPVMLGEVLEFLSPKPGQLFLDCTFGGGGHTQAILTAAKNVKVVSLDCDPEAVERSKQVQELHPENFKFYDTNFCDLDKIEEGPFDGILLDLGISSFQVDRAERGFSFRLDGPVDMRLDPRSGISAAEFLETASNEELVQAIRNYGEESKWRRVIEAIVSARGTGQLERTVSLAKLIEDTIGRRPGSYIHPATRTFQGIRIAVNRELAVIEEVLPKAFDKLKIGGVLAVISFHSLEDRQIKRFCKRMAGKAEHAWDNVPEDMKQSCARILTTKSVHPNKKEVTANPRSRSAKLRALKKTQDWKKDQ